MEGGDCQVAAFGLIFLTSLKPLVAAAEPAARRTRG